jgi:hypothetical protein
MGDLGTRTIKKTTDQFHKSRHPIRNTEEEGAASRKTFDKGQRAKLIKICNDSNLGRGETVSLLGPHAFPGVVM